MDKGRIANWIEENVESLDGADDFMTELEKEHMALADRIRDVIWEYAEIQVFDDDQATAECAEPEKYQTRAVPITDEFDLADKDNEEKKLEKFK